MARYVAKYQKYAIQARPQREVLTIDGYPVVAVEQIVLEFEQGSVRPYEIDLAQKHFRHLGVPDGLDPIYRLSAFDTDWAQQNYAWDDDTKESVERFLELSPSNNVDYVRVEAPRTPAPWPTYDKVRRVEAIVEKVKELGFLTHEVIAYERENQDRAEVIEALEKLAAGTPAEEEIPA